MKPLAECRLYTFVDAAYLHGRDPLEVARQLCDGGSDLIQLRAKNWTPGQILETAAALAPVVAQAGVGLVINDHPWIARDVGAPVCHLGQEDFFDAGFDAAAQVTGQPKDLLLGLSTHAPEQAVRALQAQPDYLAIGPIHATATKPGARPVTLDYVRWAAANVTIPWFAIGGIKLENLDEVLAAGAARICVVSAIHNAPDPVRACRAFADRLASAASAT